MSVGILAIVCLLMIPAVSRKILTKSEQGMAALPGPLRNINRVVLVGLVSALLLFLFIYWRSRALFYGDGFLVLEYLSSSHDAVISGKNLTQLLSILSFRFFLPLLTQALHARPEIVMAVINALGGVVGFWALYAISKRLTDDPIRGRFLFCGMLTSATVILFFGYIENYTWGIALGLWTLYFSLDYAIRGRHPALMVMCALLALMYHAVTVPFLLAAIMSVMLTRRQEDRPWARFGYGWLGVALVAGSFIMVGVLDLAGLNDYFVSIRPTGDNPYWFLSGAHLLDQFNLLLMVAPLGVTLTAYCLIVRRQRKNSPDRAGIILGTTALASVLVAFWIDPALGAPRDWDLLSIVGFPVSLWAAYRFSRKRGFAKHGGALIVPVCLIAVLNVGPNLYEKNHPDRALERLDALLWECPHYQTTYKKAFRVMSWGTTLTGWLGRDDLATKYFLRRVQTESKSPGCWFSLGEIYYKSGSNDSAASCFEQAIEYDSASALYMLSMSFARKRQGLLNEALDYAILGERLDSNDATIPAVQGLILRDLGRFDEAISCFRRSLKIDPDTALHLFNLGFTYYTVGRYDSALVYLQRGYQRNPRLAGIHEPFIMTLLALGRDGDAEQVVREYQAISPSAPGLDYYRAKRAALSKK
ncbi:MAG: tetratricopeptide repeat protein [candidate division Zixibacteria bacterium]|nr:tetratricopeptide repeat protein [candidate division Zixibacteria bacterium]